METCNILDCDVYQAIQIIKSRYASVFIYSLENGPRSFSSLEQEFDFITPTQVSRTLKQLTDNKLVVNQDAQYQLTPAGIELVPILDSLETWHDKYFTSK